MSEQPGKTGIFRQFPRTFWVVIFMEFFERGSYYGLMSVLALYLGDAARGGALGFSEGAIGVMLGVVTPIVYGVPILSGALAERFGYRRTLLVAFALLATGYTLAGFVTSYGAVFGALILMAVGAGTFKPIPSGSIARLTTEETSGVGFGIFYWTINLGAFLFPLVFVTWLRATFDSWTPVFLLSAAGTGLMILPTLFVYRDPPRPENTRSLKDVLVGMVAVLKDWRFVSMIAIYSCFWILYFQMFHTVLWYLKDYVDMAPVEAVVNAVATTFGIASRFTFDVQHVTVLNALTIILLQLVVSRLVAKRKALPTMITGIGLGTVGMALLAVSSHAWVFMAGIVIFSIGEMTTHPKFISYIGLIAPKDKVALYMGYSFLYGVLGSSIGGIVGGFGYEHFVRANHAPQTLWLLFSGIGVATMVGLLLHARFVSPRAERS